MIAIFRTNVSHHEAACRIIENLLIRYRTFKITIDLEDDEKILRVEGYNFLVGDICELIAEKGFICQHLPYDPND